MSLTSAPGSEQNLIELLHSRGQRVTPQRLIILRELRRMGGHVSAEQIHRAVGRELPGTSLPTVYAALDLMVELDLARRLDIGSGTSLYDARTEPHGHTVCRACGAVTDLEAEPTSLLLAAAGCGFHGESAQLLVFGVCQSCAT